MIKFRLGDYDVEISAVNNSLKDHEKDTLYLLNQRCIMSGLASNAMREQGYDGLADGYRLFQADLFRTCREHGLYREEV